MRSDWNLCPRRNIFNVSNLSSEAQASPFSFSYNLEVVFNDSNWNQGRMLQPRSETSPESSPWSPGSMLFLQLVFPGREVILGLDTFRTGRWLLAPMFKLLLVSFSLCDLGTKRFSFYFCRVLFVVLGIKCHSCLAISLPLSYSSKFPLKSGKMQNEWITLTGEKPLPSHPSMIMIIFALAVFLHPC